MKPKSDSPQDIADYLTKNGAHLVIGVLHVLKRTSGMFRGKVNLGREAGARGRNDYAARPVRSAWRLNLVCEMWVRGAYTYCLSELGEAVIDIIDERV